MLHLRWVFLYKQVIPKFNSKESCCVDGHDTSEVDNWIKAWKKRCRIKIITSYYFWVSLKYSSSFYFFLFYIRYLLLYFLCSITECLWNISKIFISKLDFNKSIKLSRYEEVQCKIVRLLLSQWKLRSLYFGTRLAIKRF